MIIPILNTKKTVAMDSSITSPAKIEQAVYTVTQGVGNSTTSTPYSIEIDGTTYTYNSSSVDTKTIRKWIKECSWKSIWNYYSKHW